MFEITLSGEPPITSGGFDESLLAFLRRIGYISDNGGTSSIPFRLFRCFLDRPEKQWLVEEMMAHLNTTRATVYRHLNRIKALDVLEESEVHEENSSSKPKKGYSLRYGSFSKAWNFVEAHIDVSKENYRRTADFIDSFLPNVK